MTFPDYDELLLRARIVTQHAAQAVVSSFVTSVDREAAVAGAYRLHVLGEVGTSRDPDFQVWLNTEITQFDGLCIGYGENYHAALMDAKATLQDGLRALDTL